MSSSIFIADITSKSSPTKYTKWYAAIITKAADRYVFDPTIGIPYNKRLARRSYPNCELHHIVPKSFGVEYECPFNYVVLTSREHFICHWLLTRMLQGQQLRKMQFAFNRMRYSDTTKHQRYFNSRAYGDHFKLPAANLGKIRITNGVLTKYVDPHSDVPTGWVLGVGSNYLQAQQRKNERTFRCEWKITHLNSSQVDIVSDLKQWCTDNNYKYNTVTTAYKRNNNAVCFKRFSIQKI